MSSERLPYIHQPERKANTHGVVILLVNEEGEILFGQSGIDNDRTSMGETKLVSESCNQIKGEQNKWERKKETCERCLEEEVSRKWPKFVEMPDNIRDAWLGSMSYGNGINAQVFCFKWIGGRQVPEQVINKHEEENDFIPRGWKTPSDLLQESNLSDRVRCVLNTITKDQQVMQRIKQIGKKGFSND